MYVWPEVSGLYAEFYFTGVIHRLIATCGASSVLSELAESATYSLL